MLPQWHVKDPGHSVKSAGGRLHLNTHTPYPLTRRSRSGRTMPLCRHIVGTYPETSLHATRQGKFTQPQSSQLADPLWTDPGLRSGISMRDLISTLKKERKKNRRRGMNCRAFSPNPRTRGKSHHHHHHWNELFRCISINKNQSVRRVDVGHYGRERRYF